MRLTLDTNILVSATIAKGNEFNLLRLAKTGRYELVLSPHILVEFKSVISRSKFEFTKQQVDGVFLEVIGACRIILPKCRIEIIKEDPTDNRVLECAVEAEADYIVSGDRHLIELERYAKIPIIKAKQMLDIINEGT